MQARVLGCVVAATLIAAAAPGAAFGATVSHVQGAARLDFLASSGEANRVTVASSGGQLVITDRGVSNLQEEGDCTVEPLDPQVVSCPAAGITALELSGGDLDDELTNATALAAQAYGEDGPDTVRGGSGDERLEGGSGPDSIDGGGGNDRVYGATLQNPGAGADADQLAGGPGDDRLFGSGGPDRLDGGPSADQLDGSGGADDLRGGDGPDALIGGDGPDLADGGPGDDTIGTEVTLGVVETSQERGNDVLLGGPGNDTLAAGPGPPLPDADTMSGGDGSDTVSYRARMTRVSVSKDGAADDGEMGEHDIVGLDVERITGGLASDTLRGGPGPDTLDGRPGDDTLDGLAGDDTLLGDNGPGDGGDRISGGTGVDVVQGDGGGDSLTGGAGDDRVEGGDGEDILRGGDGRDTLSGGPRRDVVAYNADVDVAVQLNAGSAITSQPGDIDRIRQVEDVRGGTQRDTLTGTGKANALESSGGEDYVDGEGGRDVLDGGRRADVVAARDGARDAPVSCGPGKDFAIVDRRDPVVRKGKNRCEGVDDGSQSEPQQGRVYVEPQRCAGSADDVGLALPAMRRWVPLRDSILLPSGYQGRPAPKLNTAGCAVRLTATPAEGRSASAAVSGAAVAIGQTAGRRATTTLTVESPSCAAGAQRPGTAAPAPRLRVYTGGRRGRWRVVGRYSIGASVGTDWTTVETCSSTTTIVRRGRVRVFDRVKQRTVTVRAGNQYVSRAR
jgi:Ca2+-binding RTX toxin-like protein